MLLNRRFTLPTRPLAEVRPDDRPTVSRPARRAAPPLRRFVADVMGDLTAATGFAEPRLAADWARIVGEKYANLCRPVRLKGRGARATLELAARDSAAAAQLRLDEGDLRRTINAYLGPDAIARLIFSHAGVDNHATDQQRGAALLKGFFDDED